MERRERSPARRLWPWTSVAVAAIALIAAAPAAALLFAVSHVWCRDHGWPLVLALPIALACLAALSWWWCGVEAQRRWIAAFAQRLDRHELARLLPSLPEVQRRLGCTRELDVWLLPKSETNAFVVGSRQLVITAGLAGEPPRLQAAVLAHELAHLRLGHSLTCWALERSLFGYEHAAVQTTRAELDSPVVPGSLFAAMGFLLSFTVLAVPLLLLRLMGVALGRRMEWEADLLAAECGYRESLTALFRSFGNQPEEPAEIGLYTLRARSRTHPLLAERRRALEDGHMPRADLLRSLHSLVRSAAHTLARLARSATSVLLAPPIDCVTIFVTWCFADLGALQAMIGGAFAGLPSLLPLTLLAFRGRARRPIKRTRLLRVGLLLILTAHAAFVVDPAVMREESVAGLLDAAWLVGAAAIALGVGVRAWLAAITRGAGLLFLPGRYAQRLLRQPVEDAPHASAAEQP